MVVSCFHFKMVHLSPTAKFDGPYVGQYCSFHAFVLYNCWAIWPETLLYNGHSLYSCYSYATILIIKFLSLLLKKKNHILLNLSMNCIYYRLSFGLFWWKMLCEDSFLCFLIFGSIRKNELKKNYFWLLQKNMTYCGVLFVLMGQGPFCCT